MIKHLLLLLFFFTIIAAKDSKIDIAVNDLTGNGVDKNVINIVSDRLRSEFIKLGKFRVMSRGDMDVILKEQGFQQTGMCDDNSCVVEVGQLLGVGQIVAGSVGKIGNFYTITLRMLDVEKGEILYTSSTDFEGSAKDLVSEATAQAAKSLAVAGGIIKRDETTPLIVENPTKKPKKRGTQLIRRITFGALALGAAGGGYYFNTLADDKISEQEEIQAQYDQLGYRENQNEYRTLQTQHKEASDEASDAIGTRNILYGLAGVATVGFVISIPF